MYHYLPVFNMNGVLIIALLAIATPALEARVAPYIIGGRDARPGEFPYQGSLQRLLYAGEDSSKYADKHMCGCVLVATDWVVTAAHCVGDGPGGLIVKMGMTKRGDDSVGKPEEAYIVSIISHPKWNPQKLVGDIAMVRLMSDVDINDFVKVIAMHEKGTNLDNADCVITGWGITTTGGGRLSTSLKAANVKAISTFDCQKHWRVDGSHICVWTPNQRGSCNGDSGGPAVCNGKLAGVTSYGQKGCFVSTPSVYTRISHYRDWIKQVSGL